MKSMRRLLRWLGVRPIAIGVLTCAVYELLALIAFKLDGIGPYHHRDKYWCVPLLLGPALGRLIAMNASKHRAGNPD